jgi:cytochrome b561
MMTVTRRRYSSVAITLHWVIAALIIGNIGVAWYFETLKGLAKIEPIQLHKSIGITVLILSVLRVAWRFASPPPALPADMPAWEKLLARTVQLGFYGIMLGLPLTGWALTSASLTIRLYPITLFHLVPWPGIGPLMTLPHEQMTQAHYVFVAAHHLLAKLTYLLLALHVAGAMKHLIINHDDVVARMAPFLRPRTTEET